MVRFPFFQNRLTIRGGRQNFCELSGSRDSLLSTRSAMTGTGGVVQSDADGGNDFAAGFCRSTAVSEVSLRGKG